MTSHPLSILFGASLTVLSAAGLGRLLLQALSLRFRRGEEWVLAFVTGASCLSFLVFVLAALHLARWEVFLALGLLITVMGISRGAHKPSAERLPELDPFWRGIFTTGLTLFGLLYFINALAPEVSPDGSGYHLGLVSRYLRQHGFVRITTDMYAGLSQGAEMLFLFAFAFGRHSAAAMVHFCFTLTLPLAILCYGRRFGAPAAGAAGALFVFASPVVGIDGSSAYVDVAAATVLFTLHYFLQIWDCDRNDRLLIPAGLLAGFAYAIKYTAFLGILYALGFVGWRLVRARRPWFRPLALMSAYAIALMAPWLLKNWIWLGNPFSPFLNGLFPNPYIHIGMEEDYRRTMSTSPVQGWWKTALELTVYGGALGGLTGPLFLLAPLALFGLRQKLGRQLLLAAAIFALPYAWNFGTRFLILSVPFVALALALVVGIYGQATKVLVLAHLFTCLPSVVTSYATPGAWRLTDVPWRAALRIQPEEAFLQTKLPYYNLARLVEKKVPVSARVYANMAPPESRTSRDILVGYHAAFNNTLRDVLWTGLFTGMQPVRRFVCAFPDQRLRKIRILQETDNPAQRWSISEVRMYRGGTLLTRSSAWRLDASQNPWEVGLAFDGNPVTRWLSWEGLAAWSYVEVDFGGVEVLDRVEIDCTPDQSEARMKLQGKKEEGKWVLLCAEPQASVIPPPAGIERMATRTMKKLGIDYLLVLDSDPEATALRTNPELWGVRPVGREAPGTLYQIK